MRALIQRVEKAQVSVGGKIIGKINQGLLVLLAIHQNDEEAVIGKMAEKIANLRIFPDSQDKMNLNLMEIGGEVLVVSQFTLYADAKKGNRPSFTQSAEPIKANDYYCRFVSFLREKKIKVEAGEFGAKMKVELINDGPVTIILDL